MKEAQGMPSLGFLLTSLSICGYLRLTAIQPLMI